jgi:hypothetical protein
MTREEHEPLFDLVNNPSPGSKIEAAKDFGIDLTLVLRRLTLTPDERADDLEGALAFVEVLRRAAKQLTR